MEKLEELRWKKFPVLDDGFVCLVDVMGDDASVVQAARVSYGKDKREREGEENRGLLRYLMRHRHSTPFEMAEIKLLVRVPMDCWRQWIRHRTANVNEYSTRYTEAIDSQQKTDAREWRSQAKNNKQGSGDFINADEGSSLTLAEDELHRKAREVYEERLDHGVAKEQARKDLPLSTYTEAYWKIDLHNMLHFLGLRMDSHAQKEIREYATIIGNEIIKLLFPAVWEAFEDYRLGGMFLTRLDIEVIRSLSSECDRQGELWPDVIEFDQVSRAFPDEWCGEKNREREECLGKLRRLGIVE